jgi:hypothetical protein
MEEWDWYNNPFNLREYYEVRLSSLPITGEVEQKPWSDSYWPSYQGGIADRWNDSSSPDAFTYELHDRDELVAMTEAQLKKLSPAEKYDILRGSYDYPLVESERSRTSPDDPSWFGLCHGWAPAAINFTEPKPVTVTSVDGIEVPFGSSDIKALLTYAQQDSDDMRFVGQRCNPGDDPDSPQCRSVNAGSFHVILANQLGLVGEAFVANIAPRDEVWNQPVFGFKTRVISESASVYPGAAPGTVTIAHVESQMQYISEIGAHWDARPYDRYPNQASSRTYRYKLELNSDGEIIGGEWDDASHPNFLWAQDPPELTGYWQKLAEVYAAATQESRN